MSAWARATAEEWLLSELAETTTQLLACRAELRTSQGTVRDLQAALSDRYDHGWEAGHLAARRRVVARLLAMAASPEHLTVRGVLIDAAAEFDGWRP